jgi:hypothetical protein
MEEDMPNWRGLAAIVASCALLGGLLAAPAQVAQRTVAANATAATTAASGYIVDHRCSPNSTKNGDRVRVCVQETNGGTFNAIADVSFPSHRMSVTVRLQQCRGDGTACGFVGDAGFDGGLIGHRFLASSIVAGAQGHSYRAVVYVGADAWRSISPFIAYATHAPAPVAAKRASPIFQQAKDAAFRADPGSQIVRKHLASDGDTGLVVMRFFIPSRTAALACLKGDHRSFDSNPAFSSLVSGHARSRVVFGWDTLTGDAVFKVEESETLSCNLRYMQPVIGKSGIKLPAVPLKPYGNCKSVANDPNVDKPRNHQDVYLSTFHSNSAFDPSGVEACLSVVNSLTFRWPIGALSIDAAFQIIPRKGMHMTNQSPSALRSPVATGHDSSLASGGYAIMYSGQGYPAIEAYYYPRYVGEGPPKTLYRRLNDPRPPRLDLGWPHPPRDAGGGDGAYTSMADCDKLDVNATHVHCTPYHGIKHMHPWDTDWSASAGKGGGGPVRFR